MFDIDLILPLILFFLATFIICFYLQNMFLFALSIYTAKYTMFRNINKLPKYPGVSIIKPLLGCDSCLRENLTSHFELDYPEFELLFCIKDEGDPAIDLVNTLHEEYPHVDMKVLIGGMKDIPNPMVNNMAPGYAAAKYELVWISTSRIKVSTPMLLDMVEKSFEPDVALVHQTPFVTDQPGVVGALEKICFSSISRKEIALQRLGVVVFVGMSYIVKKSMLDEIGGLAFYGKYMAEDFFLSFKLHARGYRIVLSDYPAMQNCVPPTFEAYTTRMVRWLRLRLLMIPVVAGFLEPMNETITLGFLFALTLKFLFDVPCTYVLLVHFCLWPILEYALLRQLQRGPVPFSILTYIFAWLIRELSVYWIFIKAITNPSLISWGRYSYRIKMGGLVDRVILTKCPDASVMAASNVAYKSVEQMNATTTSPIVRLQASADDWPAHGEIAVT